KARPGVLRAARRDCRRIPSRGRVRRRPGRKRCRGGARRRSRLRPPSPRPVGEAPGHPAGSDRDRLARGAPGRVSVRRVTGAGLRIGLGVDAHAFGDGVPLVLGGVTIDHPRGLVGHSDGDVIAHALADALLGAAGLADIGALFPSEDERYRGADSLALLTGAYAQVRAAGYVLVNADCVVIGQEPRVAPHREEMRRRLAAALGVEEASVNVRATTTDRLGFTGRGEGLAAEAGGLRPVEAWRVYTDNQRRAMVGEGQSLREGRGAHLEQSPPD